MKLVRIINSLFSKFDMWFPILIIFFGVELILIKDISFPFINETEIAGKQIGITLIAVGVTFLAFGFVSKQRQEIIRKDIQVFSQEIQGNIKELSSTFSASDVKVYLNQSKVIANYSSIIKKTKKHVDILGVSIMPFLWNPDFEKATIDALKRGVRFRILIPNSQGEIINILAQQENRNKESLKAEIQKSVYKLKEIDNKATDFINNINDLRNKFVIKFFDVPISSFLLFIDDRLFFSPYLYVKFNITSPCFEVEAFSGTVYNIMKDYFDNLWGDSTEFKKDSQLLS